MPAPPMSSARREAMEVAAAFVSGIGALLGCE